MNYNIDFVRMAVHLLPPILRGGFMVALVRAFLIPIRYVYGRFLEYKNGVDGRLDTTANVQYIQKRLNDTFYLTANQIYLEQGDAGSFPSFYFENERQKANYMSGSRKGNRIAFHLLPSPHTRTASLCMCRHFSVRHLKRPRTNTAGGI